MLVCHKRGSSIKKVIALIITCVILFSTTLAYAESLAAKTDQELIDLYLQVQSELLSRSSEYSLTLYAGKYQVGKDIPAGSYKAVCSGAYSSSTLEIYASKDAKYPTNTYIMAELYQSAVIGKLDLAEGNIVDITGSVITLTSYSAAQIEIQGTKATQSTNDTSAAAEISDDGLTISSGKYHVGSEIPAGTYRVECKGSYSMASFNVYDSEYSLYPSYSTILTALLGNSEIGKIELKSGNIVEIQEGSVTLYKYQGINK